MVLRSHQDQLFEIANAFVRADVPTRNRTLDWFANAMNWNHKRRALQSDPKEVASDAFMINVTVVLDRFCDPFMDNSFSKIDKIDVDYFRKNPRVDIKDETKLNADQAKADAYYATQVDGTPNFISEVFFLTLAAHHYGSEASHARLKALERDTNYFESHLRRMEAERPAIGVSEGSRGVAYSANNFTDPRRRRRPGDHDHQVYWCLGKIDLYSPRY